MVSILRAIFSFIICAVAAIGSAAAQEHDFQQWTQLTAQGSLTDKVVMYAEVQPRFTSDASRLGQVVVRPGIGVRLTPDVTAMLGYAFVHNDMEGSSVSNEHRIWEQLSWPIYKSGKALTITGRTRLEQRTVDNREGLGWRLRQQVRAQATLGPQTDVTAIAWVEPFYDFNDTEWGQRQGIEQLRTFAGVGIPLSKQVTIEPGYINQTQFRAGEDRMNHIANLTLNYRWN